MTDDGVVVLYNYYREDWFIDKIGGMMRDVFGTDPYVSTYGGWGRAAVLMAGPRLSQLPAQFNKPYAEIPGRDPSRVDVAINGVWVCRHGGIGEDRTDVDMSGRLVQITAGLDAGDAGSRSSRGPSRSAWACTASRQLR